MTVRLRDEPLERRLLLSNDVMYTLLPDEIGPQQGTFFGAAVAVSADYRVVGSPQSAHDGLPEVGMVSVYDASNTLITAILNPEPDAGDGFGFSVDISGSILVIGAPYNDPAGNISAGSAYVYDLASNSPGIPIATLVSPVLAASDEFGHDVAVFENRVVVSAHLADTGAIDAGSVYVFDLAEIDPTAPIASVANPTPDRGDRFGWSIALDGSTLVVGAFLTMSERAMRGRRMSLTSPAARRRYRSSPSPTRCLLRAISLAGPWP